MRKMSHYSPPALTFLAHVTEYNSSGYLTISTALPFASAGAFLHCFLRQTTGIIKSAGYTLPTKIAR
jgi:hypothetical protein